MSKTLWYTIKNAVPEEMVNISKNVKVVVKKSLTNNKAARIITEEIYKKGKINENSKLKTERKIIYSQLNNKTINDLQEIYKRVAEYKTI